MEFFFCDPIRDPVGDPVRSDLDFVDAGSIAKTLYMDYWSSLRPRWLDIGLVLFFACLRLNHHDHNRNFKEIKGTSLLLFPQDVVASCFELLPHTLGALPKRHIFIDEKLNIMSLVDIKDDWNSLKLLKERYNALHMHEIVMSNW